MVRNTSMAKCWIGFVSITLLVLSGCGSGNKLVQVKGVAKVDGTPTEGIQLTFHPSDGKMPSSAVSQAGGAFSVTTDLNPGIPPGSYTVIAIYPDPSVKPTESQRMQGLFEPGPDMFKGKYATKEKGLKVEVTAGTVDLPIELKK
jgi:hypothetical protein